MVGLLKGTTDTFRRIEMSRKEQLTPVRRLLCKQLADIRKVSFRFSFGRLGHYVQVERLRGVKSSAINVLYC